MKGTDQKILNAAEKQFALYGIEGTSLRQVSASAGVSQASLHYHFDGKDGLLQAVLDRCIPPLMEERLKMLEELDSQPQPAPIHAMLGVLTMPLARRAIDGGARGKRIVRLLGRLYGENNVFYQQAMGTYFRQVHLLERLQTAAPALSPIQLELRLEIAAGAIFSSLASLDSPARTWQSQLTAQPFTPWQVVDELLEFLARGFTGGESHA